MCVEGVAKLPCGVPELRSVEVGCWVWIGKLAGEIEVTGLLHGVLRQETVHSSVTGVVN